MTDSPQSSPDDVNNVLTKFIPQEPDFVPDAMPAPHGQAPESLLGKRVVRARTHYGLNVEALSRMTKLCDEGEGRGISPPTLARYESGESAPGAREIRLLCVALRITAQWLIFGDVSVPGASVKEQALLSALKDLMRDEAKAVAEGHPVMTAMEFFTDPKQIHAQRLKEARKP